MLKKYMIERDIPGVGGMAYRDLGDAAKTSNAALAQLNGIQWQYSFVTADKTFCVYLAESKEAIYEHARLSGFPASKVTEIMTIIDPSTEQQCDLAKAVA